MVNLESIKKCFPEKKFDCPIGLEDYVIGVDIERRRLVLDANSIIEGISIDKDIPTHEAVSIFYTNVFVSKGKDADAVYIFTKPI